MTHWLRRWWRDVSEMPPPWPPKAGTPPEDKVQLGEQAKRLLEDPVLQLALERMEQKLVETWKLTAIDQTEAREATYWQLKASERFRGELQRMVGNIAMSRQQQ